MKKSGVNFVVYVALAMSIIVGLVAGNLTVPAIALFIGGIWTVFIRNKFK